MSAEKWVCEYCTYANYPSAIKCTMCKGQKPLLSEDIFRLNPSPPPAAALIESSALSLSNSNLTSAAGGPSTEARCKWLCAMCTYQNWPRAQRCTQCHTRRDADVQNMQEQLKALSIRRSDPDLMASNRSSPFGSATNLAGSRANLAAARVSPSEGRQAQALAPKWLCVSCTFENWPKSLKCSMCGRGKEPASTPTEHAAQATLAPPQTPPGGLPASPERDLSAEENCVATNVVNSGKRGQARCLEAANNCDAHQERRLRQLRRQADWNWLNACMGVVENNIGAVETYLACGGNPGRSLTINEVTLLNRNSAFDVGHTLIHLAIRFHREEMLPMLLAQISGSGPGIKRVPSYVAPDLAADIRRHFAAFLRIRKGAFNCHYVNEHATFALPADIEELPLAIQEQLFDELLDRDAQKQLENPPPALNWSLEITARLGSRLMVLWNRSAGDCLLDSAMQATWGVFDRDNVLRRALADSLHQCGHLFYPRWKEYEMIQASLLHFTLAEAQWEEDWNSLLSLASQPGSSLEQLHIFALAHILRRPIIVYGVKYVKSFRGEDIGYARFEGLYLPFLWEQSFCIRSPISLGYTRGHFSALVPTEPYSRIDGARDDAEDVTFLPLMDCEMKLLPIHFLTEAEMGREEAIMRQWLDVCMTEGGLMVAQQRLHKRPLLVAQMLEEWLNHYRRIAQVISAPFARRPQLTGYLSDGDTDEE
ncbi:ubiquitin thioesterase trabid-like [Phlebotomus argentipes]|uniref:ubiquitin thioesterase trabid-like n=1 Tax=Phlebotomus argentipes TaxID=94469 RepID=UPI002892E37C|nr:ubiquitin thioesterase trabid-like [Phlebotomus argentipes]